MNGEISGPRMNGEIAFLAVSGNRHDWDGTLDASPTSSVPSRSMESDTPSGTNGVHHSETALTISVLLALMAGSTVALLCGVPPRLLLFAVLLGGAVSALVAGTSASFQGRSAWRILASATTAGFSTAVVLGAPVLVGAGVFLAIGLFAWLG